MNIEEVADQLGCDVDRIQQWMSEGMPYSGKRGHEKFVESEVVEWMVASGRAHVDNSRVCRTTQAAAKALGVNHVTLYRWQERDGFPGRTGYYPIDEISKWRNTWDHGKEANGGDAGEQIKRLKLEQMLGGMIPREEAKRGYLETHSYIVTLLQRLPAEIDLSLPATVPEDAKVVIRNRIEHKLNEIYEIASEWLSNADFDEGSGDDMATEDRSSTELARLEDLEIES